ncbi:unnamed protein product [Cylicocyclus nassatus]|uniref:Peptidase A1 domain-containing protein n=1 Tax=Cylicocyclus nassatus TaxID=53992 RepID=A0AA36DV62_CYLNA|nr:unnamed protein product [Cylicocyclus nassatus]
MFIFVTLTLCIISTCRIVYAIAIKKDLKLDPHIHLDNQRVYRILLESAPHGYTHRISAGSRNEEFTVMVTMRNSMLWIPSINCTECGSKRKFDPYKSSSFTNTGYNWSIQDDDGTVGGMLGIDNLVVEPLESRMDIAECIFGLATRISDYDNLEEVDGLFGLLPIARGGMSGRPLMRQIGTLLNPSFTIDLSQQSQAGTVGSVFYGRVWNTDSCVNEASVQIYDQFNPYQYESKISMGSFKPSHAYKAMLELIPFISGPPEFVAGIASCAGAEYIDGYYEVNCDEANSIPDLTIAYAQVPLHISSDKFITKVGDRCVLALAVQLGAGLGPDVYLGAPLFKQYCISVNFAEGWLGFAEVIEAPTNSSLKECKVSTQSTSLATTIRSTLVTRSSTRSTVLSTRSTQSPHTTEAMDSTTKTTAPAFYQNSLFSLMLSVFLIR